MFDAASRSVRGHLNNFLRYSWAVAQEREAIRYLACCLSVGIYRFETRPVARTGLDHPAPPKREIRLIRIVVPAKAGTPSEPNASAAPPHYRASWLSGKLRIAMVMQ